MNPDFKKITILFSFCILTFLLSAVHASGQSKTDSISNFIQSEMTRRKIPGLQIAVVRNGQLELLRSFGLANIENRVNVNDSTLFSINSATKAFTGVAIMQLVEKGKMVLNDPISHYLDSLPDKWQSLTVYQLLTHVSGLPDFIDHKKGGFVGGLKYPEALAAIRNYPMEFEPGTQLSYNQTNYVLLGQMIEKLNGKPFEQIIKEQQFDPAGMTKSGFGDSRDVVMDKAPTYRLSRVTERNFVKNNTWERSWEEFPELRATAGINSTAKELANWIIMLQNKTLLQPASLQTMWQAGKLNSGAYAGWAAGWVARRNTAPRAVAGIGGSRSWFYVYPDHQLAVVILTNLATSQPEDLAPEVAGFYYPELKSANGGNLPEAVLPLRHLLEKQGYTKAIQLMEKIRKKDSKFQFQERELENWAYNLLLLQHKKTEALEIFKLYVHLYPESPDASFGLAEGYDAVDDTRNAIAYYKRTLDLNPQHEQAKKRLGQLSK
ncbi:serine hydrolase [Pedobacter sp. AW31-3R]|uniref:serine hydrolase n=1 Tax=Pedobacter sp. AW31-3R TaxID=3445781 RepID=UPI003FA181A1